LDSVVTDAIGDYVRGADDDDFTGVPNSAGTTDM
jgi:hypothetical protein